MDFFASHSDADAKRLLRDALTKWEAEQAPERGPLVMLTALFFASGGLFFLGAWLTWRLMAVRCGL